MCAWPHLTRSPATLENPKYLLGHNIKCLIFRRRKQQQHFFVLKHFNANLLPILYFMNNAILMPFKHPLLQASLLCGSSNYPWLITGNCAINSFLSIDSTKNVIIQCVRCIRVSAPLGNNSCSLLCKAWHYTKMRALCSLCLFLIPGVTFAIDGW